MVNPSRRKGGIGQWVIPVVVVLALFVAGIIAGYVVAARHAAGKREAAQMPQSVQQAAASRLVTISYPLVNGLYPEQVGVRASQGSTLSLAEAVVREFLHGPGHSDVKTALPDGSLLLGVYLGEDGMLYVDLSNDFRANFRGDALAEFMVLRGLYKSVTDNVQGIRGIRILIGGREAESIGGHILLEALTPGALSGVYNAPK